MREFARIVDCCRRQAFHLTAIETVYDIAQPCRAQNVEGVTMGYLSASASKSLSPVIK